jgi:PAS domain S-box-containing protein
VSGLQNTLEQERATLRVLIDNLPDGVFLKDRESRFLFVNQFIAELMGVPDPATLQGKTDHDFYPKKVADALLAEERIVITTRQKLLNKEESRPVSGKLRYILTSKVPILDARGEVTGLLGITRDITEHHKLEENLQRERSLLLTLINSLPDYVYMKDRNSRFILTNKAQAALVGASDPKELVGKTDHDFVPKELADRYRTDDVRIIESGIGETNIEEPSQAAEGTMMRSVLTTKVPIFNAAGMVSGLVGISHDITERKELEKKNQQLATFVQSSDDAIVASDLDHRIIVWNEGAKHLYGYSAEEIIDSPTSQLIPPDLEEETQRMRERVLHDEARVRCETIRLRKDGAKIFVDLILSAIRNEKGGIVGIASIARDITDRKRAEEALRISEQRFRGIFQHSALGMAIVSPNSYFLQANDAFCTMLGYTETELRERTFLEVTFSEDWPIGSENVRRSLAGEIDSFHFEKRYIHKNGTVVWGLVSSSLIRNAQNTPLHFITQVQDITVRKQVEEEKAKLQAQLSQAQKMESVGRLAGGVAHDFNNMLLVILGHTEMALERLDLAHPLHADLEEVHKAAERSAGLTRQLLAFARKQTVAPRVLDLNQIVEGMLTMLQRLVGENVHLAWRPKADLWPIRVDPSQLDQILTNLCINSRDAIADVGSIAIETDNSAIDEAYCADHLGFKPGEYVQLAVTDDGCGMDKETVSHLFEPFFTTKGAGKGTGLGLATVYGIVKQNDGFINVYSELDHGTRFTIYLPRHSSETEQAQRQETEGLALRGQETILLVEDEPASLRLIGKMLEEQGYTVLAANTPGEAIRLAKEHDGEIHLLMTDLIMPEMNGRDLARNLLSLFPRLKRLFASGYTANVIAHQGVLDEGVHFIQKPFSKKDLAAKVREALESE